jgi:hypothetical protein
MPFCSGVSCREPRWSQTPMLMDRTCGIDSVTSLTPLSRISRVTMFERHRRGGAAKSNRGQLHES